MITRNLVTIQETKTKARGGIANAEKLYDECQ